MQIHGKCDPRFGAVKDAFAANFAEGLERGASFAATVDGKFVVDIWGGDANTSGAPWVKDTIVNVYSTTKTMTALAALVAADRGEIDFDEKVSHYWPEFAAAGKDDVRVKHLMSHSAGLSGLDAQVPLEAMYDWNEMTQLLAAQAPWWPPGTQSGYHALTQGFLVGEVVKRATGAKTLGKFFRKEIAKPLKADFFIGLKPSEFGRVADLEPPPGAPPGGGAPPGSIAERTFKSPPINAAASRTKAWRVAEIPAANGHGNARSVCRVQTALACGGKAFGERIMSKAGAARVFEQQTNGPDLVLGVPVRFGLGYGLNSGEFPFAKNPHTCFWGGWGGSLVLVDADARVCCAYVMNKMGGGTMGDMRAGRIAQAFYSAL